MERRGKVLSATLLTITRSRVFHSGDLRLNSFSSCSLILSGWLMNWAGQHVGDWAALRSED